MELDKIYNDDCMKVLQSLLDNCVDFVLTDPPYLFDTVGGGEKFARSTCQSDET